MELKDVLECHLVDVYNDIINTAIKDYDLDYTNDDFTLGKSKEELAKWILNHNNEPEQFLKDFEDELHHSETEFENVDNLDFDID